MELGGSGGATNMARSDSGRPVVQPHAYTEPASPRTPTPPPTSSSQAIALPINGHPRFPESPGSKDAQDDDDNADLSGIDVTARALRQFEVIDKNVLVRVTTDGTKHEESIPCHCQYNPSRDARTQACGENSDCINRLVQMECNPLTCPCGSYCLNRRFQKRQYAKVRLIDAGRKGFGMQALADLESGQFVMEYMGEIVSTAQFRKRARVYQQEGIRHQYFMSIGNNKIIDATRKGSVARFINHSCGPNCVLQKWMVAGAIRMGIFAERPIKRGEEITFDYKFERMAGAEPQPCYCGAPECKGIIGVAKERRRKHVQVAEEADVDIEDDGDDAADIDEEIDDLTVTKRQRDDIRRRHAAMDDDDYGSSGSNRGELSDSEDSDDPDAAYGSRQQRRGRRKGLTSPEQVLKFVQIMHQSAGETRIIGILIGKLMETSDRRLLKSLIGLQALGILRSWLQEYKDDDVILIKILQCIDHLPISTRNSIEESRLEDVVAPLCSFSDENVASIASKLVERWKTLRVVFKIPKKSRKESANITPSTSVRESPNRTNSTPPVVSHAEYSNSNSPAHPSAGPGWQQQQQQQQPTGNSASMSVRMRSASPAPHDSGAHGHSVGPHSVAANGWGARPAYGYRVHSPAAGPGRFNRSPGRAGPSPYSSNFRPRYGSGFHTSRSRSPLGFRRTSSYSRFSRNSTAGGDYRAYPPHTAAGPQQQQQQPPLSTNATSLNPTTSSAQSVAAVCSSTESQPAGGKALAPGWRTAYTADGVPYYYHESTKETQWEAPLAEPDRTAATVGSTDRVLSSTAMAIVAPQPVAAQPVDQQRVFSAAGDATVPTTAAGDSRLPLESGRWPPAATAPASRGFAGVAAAPVAAVSMAVSGVATPAVVHEEKVDGFSKSRVDEIIERTMRLGNPSSSTMSLPQLPGSTTSGIVSSASGGSGSMQQLVTPDTDGEPSGSAVHQSRSLAGSSSLRKHSTPGSITGSPAAGPGGPARREKLEKKATAELAAYVVRQMNKYKSQMAHDEFKHEARKITKILMEKERKLPGFDPVKLIVLTAHKKAKVKQFVSEYMTRLAGRRGSSLSSVAGSPAGSAVGKTPPGPPFTPANI